jgi:phosphoribosylformylglycinamidine synthase
MNVAVVCFPASTCDLDLLAALTQVEGCNPKLVRHDEEDLSDFAAAILPGGFAYGDYLRAGAIAARTPVMTAVARLAAQGRPVLGICNGFQILVEAGLLPGSLLRNQSVQFICEWVRVRVENDATPFSLLTPKGSVLRLPIAHNEGRFYLPPREWRALERSDGIVFRYVDGTGAASRSGNSNGSVGSIAGIANAQGNVVGLMPHPERACDTLLSPDGSVDGQLIFQSLLRYADGVK